MHYKSAQGLILIYDVTDKNTFNTMRYWIRHMKEFERIYTSKVLVGNKCHEPNRQVTEEEGKKLAEEYGIAYFETSTKTNQNIDEAFEYLAREIINNWDKRNECFVKLRGKNKEEKETKKGCSK